MSTNAKTLAGGERESCNLKNKPSINFYALLKLYIRDG